MEQTAAGLYHVEIPFPLQFRAVELMRFRSEFFAAGFVLFVLLGAFYFTRVQESPAQNSESMHANWRIQQWHRVDYLRGRIAQFRTVFWEPGDTTSLRKLIFLTEEFRGKRILEIGTGSGLISLCCLQAGAGRVVATDINPNAIDCARFNAAQRNYENALDLRLVRQVAPEAYSVIRPQEKFDIIISNPPWEDDVPRRIDEFALYDPGFRLLDSLLRELKRHLNSDGYALLAYGCVSAIRAVISTAARYQLKVEILDNRSLDELDEVFLPGMLLKVSPE